MEYFAGKPELIQELIANTWMKYKEWKVRTFLNPSELTYFLFDNLFRVVKLST